MQHSNTNSIFNIGRPPFIISVFSRKPLFVFESILISLSIIFFHQPVLHAQLIYSVNPFVGTAAHGHTFPGATAPFGMVQLSPDTRVEGWDACGGYHYSDSTILGFSHTHLSGTGIPDYGDVLFLPATGRPGLVTAQKFSHQNETARPGYYRVSFDNDRITAELTATTRVGVHRYTFPASRESNIIINLHHGLGPDRVLDSWLEFASDAEIRGERHSTGWAKDQHVYFVAQFSKPFERFGDLNSPDNRSHKISGNDVRAYVRFATTDKEQIVVKVGISSVDIEGARRNLQSEVPRWDFDNVRIAAEEQWNRELSKIEIEGGTGAQRRTFSTALYHAMLAPNVSSDVDGRYRGMDGQIRTTGGSILYTVFSLWDTFRTEHPLLTIIDQERTTDFIRSMLAKYSESGTLPVWELASNETWTMVGYHSIPVLVDAYVKGIRGFDAETAFEAMKKSAMADRYGLQYYRRHGFIPGDRDAESVSKTLEYAYDDWCIAQMARMLGKSDDAGLFSERAQFYKNVFDRRVGFMRGKRNGNWVEPFDPTSVTIDFTEANAWQYTFFVPHDIPGLQNLLGGRKELEKKLDGLFFSSSEMAGRNQSDITGMVGQYAQGNEPSHHVAYLYAFTDSPWKTQHLVRRILDSLYTPLPEGLCGNDDCGQMSAWYVMSALGLYPLLPGAPFYVTGSPLFEKATIHLENGKSFVINAPGNTSRTGYVREMKINGKRVSSPLLLHETIMNGGSIEFAMSARPVSSNPLPDELPGVPRPNPIVPVPVIKSDGQSFKDSMKISISSPFSGAEIFFSFKSQPAQSDFRRYERPFFISEDKTVSAFSRRDGFIPSRIVTASFTKARHVGTLKLYSQFAPQYAAGGSQALVDGLRGGDDFHLGTWQGYEGTDLVAILDLEKEQVLDEVSLGCLQDNNAWIFFPQSVEFSFSHDGTTFSRPVVITTNVPPNDPRSLIRELKATNLSVTARYVRLVAKGLGICPPWHKGAGEKAWLFVDEITIKTRESK